MLREIVCIFVVLCYTQAANIGSWGVDIFFVISGFMLVYSTSRNWDRFFLKRSKKIIHLYWSMTIVTGLAVCIAHSLFNSYEFKWEYLIKSLLFIPYRHSGIDSPLYGLGWTLNYEIFVYLIFGISMQLSHKYRAVITSVVCIILTIGQGIIPIYFIHYYRNGVLLEFATRMILYYLLNRFTGCIHLHLCRGMILTVFMLFLFVGSVSRYLNMFFASTAFVGAWKIEEHLPTNSVCQRC